ncbi:class I SAM-dependent methyltransferase [Cellulosimicrobium funkei]
MSPGDSLDPGSRADRAASFEHGAAQYASTRPSYPDAAVDWLVPDGAHRVLDLAAGTGKLTERLVARGLDVVAVEPSDAMRDRLAETVPGAEALPGSAEAVPLPDSSVDAVLVAQAWHWFSPAAQPEIARVLRPGGRLGIVWNVRDSSVDWVGRFTEIIHRGDTLEHSYREPALSEHLFTTPEHRTVPWADRVLTSSLRPLAASRSYLLTLPPARREELLDEIDRLVATHPDLAGRTEVDLPYLARCWRADVRPDAPGAA